MTQIRKTPGVYVTELDAFGNSVVPVPTAIPAFIGYTEQTSFNGKDITFQPIKISSFSDFTNIFGGSPTVQFNVTKINSPSGVDAARTVALNTINAALASATAAQQPAGATGNKTTAQTAADTAVTAIKNILQDATQPIASVLTATAVTTTATAALAAAEGKATGYLTAVNALIHPTSGTAPTADVVAVYNYELAAANAYNDLINEYKGTNMTAYLAAQDKLDAANLANPQVPADLTAARKELSDLTNTINNQIKNSDMAVNGVGYTIDNATINYRLWSSMKLFYANGGNDCYIISLGAYDTTGAKYLSDTDPFTDAIDSLKLQTEPTMLVIPDAVELNSGIATDTPDKEYALCYALQEHMLSHCGGDTQDKIAILDIPGGYAEPTVGKKSYEYFRDGVSVVEDKFFSYGAAYYPWLNTVIYELKDVDYNNFTSTSTSVIQGLLNIDAAIAQNPKAVNYVTALFASQPDPTNNITRDQAHAALSNISSNYKLLISALLDQLNLMPPSGAMAGIYTTVDNNEGVWVAPANKGVQSVISPSINIAGDMQDDLNVPIDGKSICAIRSFTGRGTLVWGARTLDGNSNDWRYVNIRRTLLYVEQSVKAAAFAYVFAPNVPTTWVDVTAMISNFLTGLWNQGGLVGTKVTDAFSVSVGLGVTMSNDDIQNGYMRVAVKVALSHPAEFIDITFQQQQQA